MSQTVERAIAIVELLSESSRSLGEVAERLVVHKSTALRLLQTLEKAGFARRGDNGRWLVGTRLIGIAQHSTGPADKLGLPRQCCSDLRSSCTTSANLWC